MSRHGVTLVEVLFALIILATAVLSAVLLLPLGVKAVEQSRYQMYASLKATELLDLFSQSRKNWSINDHEIDLGDYTGAAIRLQTNTFSARSMPDLEQVLLSQSGSCFPVPMEIARRLDAPGDAIASLLADGGLLFYPDPFPTRDGLRQAVRFGNLSSPVPEMQKLVFGIVTPAQQNALPGHPSVHWPYYEMYPFPPQTKLWLPSWTYKAERCAPWNYTNPSTGAVTTYRLQWTGPVKSSSSTADRYEGANWEWMATNRPGSLWASGFASFQNMARYGYSPLWYKISYESGGVSYDVSDVDGTPPVGEPMIDNKDDIDLPPKPGGPAQHWRGRRIQEDVPTYFAGAPAAAAFTPAYVFDDELNMRLPSLGMRRYYRQLAKKLWDDLNTAGLGDPLTTDLTTAPNSALHPARVLALVHLADAAMTVTGYRLPYLNTYNDVDPSNEVDLNVPATTDPSWVSSTTTPPDAPDDKFRTYKAPGSHVVTNQFAGNRAEANPDGTLKAGTEATATEIAEAKQVHENMTHWINRFCALYPYDWNVPRPANRQMAMDRPLLAWDLFDGANAARRIPSNYSITADLNRYGDPTYSSASESFYPVLTPPGYAGAGGQYPGFENFYGASTTTDDVVGGLNLYTNWRTGFDQLRGTNHAHWWFGEPFAPHHRARLLVFWAVDWKSYEDAESTPSVPLDVGFYQYSPQGDAAAPEDHPEAALVWTDANRNARNSGDSDSGSFNVNNTSYWYGQFGADRNGNGAYDVGRVPASARMRATEVARFVFYDPVTYRSLRR